MQKVIRITSRKISYVLLGTIGFLLISNLVTIYLRFEKGFEHLKGFSHGFYFDAEANFPSLYSALAILLSSAILWRIGSREDEKAKRRSVSWKILSIFFVLLAVDEFGSVHEFMIQPMRGLVEQSSLDSDYLYFAWFIPYAVLVLVLGVVLGKFFFTLPLGTRWIFTLAGVVFLSGAVGMEMIGGKYWADQGWAIDGSDPVDINYALLTTVEELLEMLGVVIFIYGLTRFYLQDKREHSLLITIKDAH